MSEQKTGAEIHSENSDRAKIAKEIAKATGEKRWCIEQTVKLLNDSQGLSVGDVKKVLDTFYEFLTIET